MLLNTGNQTKHKYCHASGYQGAKTQKCENAKVRKRQNAKMQKQVNGSICTTPNSIKDNNKERWVGPLTQNANSKKHTNHEQMTNAIKNNLQNNLQHKSESNAFLILCLAKRVDLTSNTCRYFSAPYNASKEKSTFAG